MTYDMFNRHPYKGEVMSLYNLDTKMRDVKKKLRGKEPVAAGLLNLLAIDICQSYVNLIEFIYLRKKAQAPVGENIKQILERLLAKEEYIVRSDILRCIDVVVSWKETQLPLMSIKTTEAEVKAAFDSLECFYLWVDKNYFY